MINRIKDIGPLHLSALIKMGFETVNKGNSGGRVFTQDDAFKLTSHDGFSIIIEFDDCNTIISVIDIFEQEKKNKVIEDILIINRSPLQEGSFYTVNITNDLNFIMHQGDNSLFKKITQDKIAYYNENFEFLFIQENFLFFQSNNIHYSFDELLISYDFDENYQPLGKLTVFLEPKNYSSIKERYAAKQRMYLKYFDIVEESLLLKHYIFLCEMDNFNEIFTQFGGPLPKRIDLDLMKAELNLAKMIFFNNK